MVVNISFNLHFLFENITRFLIEFDIILSLLFRNYHFLGSPWKHLFPGASNCAKRVVCVTAAEKYKGKTGTFVWECHEKTMPKYYTKEKAKQLWQNTETYILGQLSEPQKASFRAMKIILEGGTSGGSTGGSSGQSHGGSSSTALVAQPSNVAHVEPSTSAAPVRHASTSGNPFEPSEGSGGGSTVKRSGSATSDPFDDTHESTRTRRGSSASTNPFVAPDESANN